MERDPYEYYLHRSLKVSDAKSTFLAINTSTSECNNVCAHFAL